MFTLRWSCAGRWSLVAGCWVLAGWWLVAAGGWLLVAGGCWSLVAGRWLLGAGWVLAGCWMFVAGRWSMAVLAACSERRINNITRMTQWVGSLCHGTKHNVFDMLLNGCV